MSVQGLTGLHNDGCRVCGATGLRIVRKQRAVAVTAEDGGVAVSATAQACHASATALPSWLVSAPAEQAGSQGTPAASLLWRRATTAALWASTAQQHAAALAKAAKQARATHAKAPNGVTNGTADDGTNGTATDEATAPPPPVATATTPAPQVAELLQGSIAALQLLRLHHPHVCTSMAMAVRASSVAEGAAVSLSQLPDDTKQDKSAAPVASDFKRGDRVDTSRYAGGQPSRSGVIAAVHGDGTFDIAYSDSEEEEESHVSAARLQLSTSASSYRYSHTSRYSFGSSRHTSSKASPTRTLQAARGYEVAAGIMHVVAGTSDIETAMQSPGGVLRGGKLAELAGLVGAGGYAGSYGCERLSPSLLSRDSYFGMELNGVRQSTPSRTFTAAALLQRAYNAPQVALEAAARLLRLRTRVLRSAVTVASLRNSQGEKEGGSGDSAGDTSDVHELAGGWLKPGALDEETQHQLLLCEELEQVTPSVRELDEWHSVKSVKASVEAIHSLQKLQGRCVGV